MFAHNIIRYVAFGLAFLMVPPLLAQNNDEKLPVPDAAAQKETLKLIKEVYGDEWENAKTKQQKQALAKKLLDGALESQDPTNRYVLLQVAKDIATQGRDGKTAFQAIDGMANEYQIDAIKMKASVLYSLSKKARMVADHKSIAEKTLILVDQAVVKNDFDTAKKLVDTAISQARKARNTKLIKTAVAQKKDLKEIIQAYGEAKEAGKTLEENPLDPEANLLVGKYRCFIKGNWDNGLVVLALGSDNVLKELAIKELTEPMDATEQVKLGDGWWDLAEKRQGMKEQRLRKRAVYWYRKASPQLSGLVKDKVNKRLEQVASESPEAVSENYTHKRIHRKMVTLAPILVSVKEPWPVFMNVKRGQTLLIKATGRWKVLPGGKWHGPNDARFYLRGRLGSGKPFKIGSDFTLQVDEDGVLYFGMLEGGKYSNNSGKITVVIQMSM